MTISQNNLQYREYPREIKNKKLSNLYRSSLPDMFCKKGVLKILVKFTGKHLC